MTWQDMKGKDKKTTRQDRSFIEKKKPWTRHKWRLYKKEKQHDKHANTPCQFKTQEDRTKKKQKQHEKDMERTGQQRKGLDFSLRHKRTGQNQEEKKDRKRQGTTRERKRKDWIKL
jgi:hypothetical protein